MVCALQRLEEETAQNTVSVYVYDFQNPHNGAFDIVQSPLGLWGWQVHYGDNDQVDGTLEWGQQAGLHYEDAQRIAEMDNSADSGPTGPMPGQDPGRHFNTGGAGEVDSRVQHSELALRQAVYLERRGAHEDALQILGTGLHSVQDVPAHSPDRTHNWLGIRWHGKGTDDPLRRSAEYRATRDATLQYIERFNNATRGVSSEPLNGSMTSIPGGRRPAK